MIRSERDKWDSRGAKFPRAPLPLLPHQPGRSPSNVGRAANQRGQLGACPLRGYFVAFPLGGTVAPVFKKTLFALSFKELKYHINSFKFIFWFEKVKKNSE